MTIETTEHAKSIELTIIGEIDASSSILLDDEITKAVTEAKHSTILINCSELTYISSAGLGVFMAHIEDCNEANIKLILFEMSPKIFSVFSMLGLDQLIPIKSTKEEAINYANG